MRKILLNDVRLYGYHGVPPLERIIGTEFRIALVLELTEQPVLHLNDSIDYERVYALLQKEFSVTEQLLEVLSDRIIASLFSQFKQCCSIEITIEKLNAPISHFNGKVGVCTQKQRAE